MNFYVYETTNNINGKKYIGKRRCKCNIEDDYYLGSGKFIKIAISKYGRENFSKKILKVCEDENSAFKWEEHFIKEVDAFKNPNYYNISAGGKAGFKCFAGKSEEELKLWRQRMSESRKGRVMTDEWIAKIVKTRKERGIGVGEKNGMYGRTGGLSPVSKAVLMLDFDGNIVNRFDAISVANKVLNNDRANSNISRTCVNKKGTAYGYLWLFEEDYNNMIKNNSFNDWLTSMRDRYLNRVITNNLPKNLKSVFQLDKDTLEVVNSFNSVAEASNATGIGSSSISRTCRHGSNTAGGFSWIFQHEYNNLDEKELKELYKHKYKPIPKSSREKQKVAVFCLTTNQRFDSVKEAIDYFKLCKGTKISDACRGKRKIAGKHPVTGEGLKWMYYDDYLKII